MRATSRSQYLLLAVLTVWCLGCESFEIVAKSFTARTYVAGTDSTSVELPDDDCHCVFGHAAVVLASTTPSCSRVAVSGFVDLAPAALLPRPEPPLRPPVA